MKVITTSGKQFEINFEGTEAHQQQRSLFQYLKSVGQFVPMDPDNDLNNLIQETSKAPEFAHLEKDVITMTCSYFYNKYAEKFKAGEIDDIDFVILTLSSSISALTNW